MGLPHTPALHMTQDVVRYEKMPAGCSAFGEFRILNTPRSILWMFTLETAFFVEETIIFSFMPN